MCIHSWRNKKIVQKLSLLSLSEPPSETVKQGTMEAILYVRPHELIFVHVEMKIQLHVNEGFNPETRSSGLQIA